MAETLEKEHEVNIVTTKKNSDSTLKISSIPTTEFIPEKLIMLGNTIIDHLLAKGLGKLLRNNRPDLIHVQNPWFIPAVISVSGKLSIPAVSTLRDNPQLTPERAKEVPLGASKLWRRRFNKILKCYNKIEAIISISDYVRREYIKAGIPWDKITTIYNMPPRWKFIETPKSSRNVTLFAPGRITKFKGFEVLAKAVALTVKKVKNISVIIVGNGPYFEYLKILVKHHNLDEYIKIIPAVPYQRVKELYFNSDIVLLLSTFPEPFSRLPLEAMAAGKPLIATNTGGTTEAVEHNVNGLLVPPNDPEKTAEAIIKLVEDEELRKRMGTAGRKILEKKFNPDDIINKTIKLYEKVVSEYNIKK